MDCDTNRFGAHIVRVFRGRGAPLALRYLRANRRNCRRILRSRLAVSEFLVCLSRPHSRLQHRTGRHGASSYVSVRFPFRLSRRPTIYAPLLRSSAFQKLGFFDCVPVRILGDDDNPVCTTDGLISIDRSWTSCRLAVHRGCIVGHSSVTFDKQGSALRVCLASRSDLDQIYSRCKLFLRIRYVGFTEKPKPLHTATAAQASAACKFRLCRISKFNLLKRRTLAQILARYSYLPRKLRKTPRGWRRRRVPRPLEAGCEPAKTEPTAQTGAAAHATCVCAGLQRHHAGVHLAPLLAKGNIARRADLPGLNE